MNKISSTILALAKRTDIDLQTDGTPKTNFQIHGTWKHVNPSKSQDLLPLGGESSKFLQKW